MSRILPLQFDDYGSENDETNEICPRYLKWTKRVKAFDFSKRKKVTIERPMPSFHFKFEVERSLNTTPKKSSQKSIFSRIRKGGQNFKVRCKTSAELWRRWIRGGIYYDKNHGIVEENVGDEKETKVKEINTNDESVCAETDINTEKLENIGQEKNDDKKENIVDIHERSDEKQEVKGQEMTNKVSMPEVVAHND